MDDHQTLTTADAGRVPDAPGDEAAPETILEVMGRALITVTNTKAWALAKADSVEARIAAAGGAVPPELKALLDNLRAAAQ